MKKPNGPFLLLLGVVAFYQTSAFAQSMPLGVQLVVDQIAHNQKAIEDKAAADKKIAEEKKLAEEKDAEPKFVKTKPADAKVKKKDTISLVDADEFRKLGLGLVFVGNELRLTGNLAAQCANQLIIDTSKEASSEEKNDSTADEDDLIAQSTKFGVRISFRGNSEVKTLSDCVAFDTDAPQVDLSKESKLSRSLLSDKELAVAGILDASKKIAIDKDSARSDEFKRALKAIEVVNCTGNCLGTPEAVRNSMSAVKTLNPKLMGSLLPKLLEASIKQLSDRIAKAKNMNELEKVLGELKDLADSVPGLKISAEDKALQLASIAEQFQAIVAKNRAIAFDLKSEKERTRSADFMIKAHEFLAKLPGIDEDSKDEALEIAASFKKNGDERLGFLSDIDPKHSEVVNDLRNANVNGLKLQRNKDAACKGLNNRYAFSRCTNATNKLEAFVARHKTMSERYEAAKRMDAIVYAPANHMSTANTWFNSAGAPASAGTRPGNLSFTLNPSVMPNAGSYNASADLDARNVFANNLVYNQAYNNPYMKGGQMSLQTSNLPTAIAIPGVSDLPVPQAASQRKSAPSFNFES